MPDRTDTDPATDPTRAVATEPQEVTVAPIDVNAAASLDDALGFLTERERPIVEQAFARHRLASVSSASAEGGEHYRHVKRGTEYAVVGRASLQNANAVTLTEAACMVVYRDGDGRLWAREESEFMDGRFELIAASPEPVPATNQAGEVKGPNGMASAQVERIASAVMQWGAPHFKHMVAFSTLCEAVEASLAARPLTSQEGEVQAILKTAQADCGCRIPSPFDEVAEHAVGLALAAPAIQDPPVEWGKIDNAPRDGTVFIARNADHRSFGSWPMVRSVRHVVKDGAWKCLDGGAWLIVSNHDADYGDGTDSSPSHHVPFSIAADELNQNVRYEWIPLHAVAPALATQPATSQEGEGFLAQLRRVNLDRYEAWVEGADAGIMFDALELGGEVGELLNVVKKLEREERGWRGSRANPADFADECADVLICLDKLARRRNVDLAAATIAKFNATSDKVGLPHRLAATPTPPTLSEDLREANAKIRASLQDIADAEPIPNDAVAFVWCKQLAQVTLDTVDATLARAQVKP